MLQANENGQKQVIQVEWVHCHRKPERSFFFRGKQFPVCARCTGMYLGFLSFFVLTWHLVVIPSWIAFLLPFPTAIDGYTQGYYPRESNNFIRFTTGLASTIGFTALSVNIGTFIAERFILPYIF